MTKIKSIILPLFFLLFFCTSALAQIPQQKYETRAVWLTTLNGLDWPKTKAVSPASRERQKRELIAILDKYQELHLNTVLLQTRVRGSVIYPSSMEGWDPCLTGEPGKDPGYDPLKFAIDECHKRGLELHCWVVTIPSGNADVHKKLGNKSVTRTHPAICKKIKNYWYLDPGHPETKEYLASVCAEMTRKYDIDGIHFDFIRYTENSANTLDRDSYRRYGRGQNLADWRRNNITACVRAMYNAIKAIKPWVKVTCAPLGKYRDTDRFSSTGWNGYNKVYQESQRWMREGIMDAVYPMIYYKGNHFYPFVRDWLENSYGRPAVPGLGIYFLHPSEGNWVLADVQREMNYCRSLGLGVAHYRSKFLTDNTKGLYDWCKKVYYPYPALVPGMTWQTKEVPNAPASINVRYSGNGAELDWSDVSDTKNNTYVTYNVYRSENKVVNINVPQNLVAARLLKSEFRDTKADKKYYYAVTAVNRFGNESAPLQSVAAPNEGPSDVEYAHGQVILAPVNNVRSVQINDLSGRVIKEVPYSTNIEVAELEPGSYQVVFITQDNRRLPAGIFFK